MSRHQSLEGPPLQLVVTRLLHLDLATMYISFLTLLALPFMATISASNMFQTPLNGPADQADPVTPLTTTAPNLADLLTIQNSVSIFYSYAREIQLSEIFVRAGASNTLLVPTNPAVMALARKPCVIRVVELM